MNPSQSPDEHPHDPAEHGPMDDGAEVVLAALEQELAEARAEVLRTRADMDNLRKRLAREMDGARRYAGERILTDLLPVMDSLEQGLASLAEHEPAREGLELTYKQLGTVLERQSLLAIDPLGQAFDPSEHQAISTQVTDAHPENTVLTVLQKGFRLHDRVLRPALVIVAAAG